MKLYQVLWQYIKFHDNTSSLIYEYPRHYAKLNDNTLVSWKYIKLNDNISNFITIYQASWQYIKRYDNISSLISLNEASR